MGSSENTEQKTLVSRLLCLILRRNRDKTTTSHADRHEAETDENSSLVDIHKISQEKVVEIDMYNLFVEKGTVMMKLPSGHHCLRYGHVLSLSVCMSICFDVFVCLSFSVCLPVFVLFLFFGLIVPLSCSLCLSLSRSLSLSLFLSLSVWWSTGLENNAQHYQQ